MGFVLWCSFSIVAFLWAKRLAPRVYEYAYWDNQGTERERHNAAEGTVLSTLFFAFVAGFFLGPISLLLCLLVSSMLRTMSAIPIRRDWIAEERVRELEAMLEAQRKALQGDAVRTAGRG